MSHEHHFIIIFNLDPNLSLDSFEFKYLLSNNKIAQFWSLLVLERDVHCKPILMWD